MQLSKPKLSAAFVKEFDEKIYDTEIDLSEIEVNTSIIEEQRDDVKVIYEGFKDLVSGVDFDIKDGKLYIKVLSKEASGISTATKIYTIFTMENKLSIFLPIHFKNYVINGHNSNIRINNLKADNVTTISNNGSVKVKYCELENDLNIKTENALVSLKSLEVNGDLTLKNDNGVSKVKTLDVEGNITLHTNNGMVSAKDVKSKQTVSISTNNGHIDLDDVYGNVVNIAANTGIVEYFNGNFNKKFEVNFDVKNGVVKTNVNREEIH